jgi:nitroimidazol reductase NimA-like FMN-containing flavoprotein (pyridoxamine 5'-phosphate oxidase superfamily)
MAEDYLRYVEETPADVSDGSLLRLAGALRTTADRLRGGDVDLPPGQGGAAAHPALEEISPAECWERLGAHGVGRVALPAPQGARGAREAPTVLPVNYSVLDGAIVYHTSEHRAAATSGDEVAFEVDRVDDALHQGWSVLAVGPAEEVTQPDRARELAARMRSRPWAGGARPALVRIVPRRLTGRRIVAS